MVISRGAAKAASKALNSVTNATLTVTADTAGFAGNDTDEGKAQNRRIEFVVK